MPTFDGDNLTITLDSGVTEVDVIDGIYEPWKDWMLASPLNRKYPQAFVSDGGNPLNAIINQGSYIFLQNQYGWRIKPPEEDITIYLTGNLAVNDTTIEAVVPTTGAFTAAIIGLQPVTQGVSEQLTDGVEQITYIGKEGVGVTVSPLTGVDSSEYPQGTREFPCKTETNFDDISINRGLHNIYVMDNITIASDHSDGHILFGDNPQTVNINCTVASDVSNCKFQDCYITGQMGSTGGNIIWECIVGSITNANGFIYQSTILGPIVVSDDMSMERCWIAPTATNQEFDLDFNGLAKTVIMSQWSAGRVNVKNMVAGSFLGIAGTGGRLVIDSTSTGGTAVYGGSILIENNGTVDTLRNSSVAGAVWDQELESEGNYTAKEIQQIGLAALAGEVSISGNTITFKTPNGNVTRMVSTTTDTGERTAIALTP